MKPILEMTGEQEEVDLVAEFMGWHREIINGSAWWAVPPISNEEHKAYSYARNFVSTWNPFKNWGDAGMVVERMKEKKWEIDLLSTNGSDEYVCYFKRMSGKKPWRTVKARAADVPTAISRAALLTTLLTVEGKDAKD